MLPDFGIYKLRANREIALTQYAYTFQAGVDVDLLSIETPDGIRCADYSIADYLCTNPEMELAALIATGDLAVVDKKEPDFRGHS